MCTNTHTLQKNTNKLIHNSKPFQEIKVTHQLQLQQNNLNFKIISNIYLLVSIYTNLHSTSFIFLIVVETKTNFLNNLTLSDIYYRLC